MKSAKLAVVPPAPLPERVTVLAEVQTGAHAINTMAGRIAGSVGRNWTTEPQIAAAAAECLELAKRAIELALLLRKGGA